MLAESIARHRQPRRGQHLLATVLTSTVVVSLSWALPAASAQVLDRGSRTMTTRAVERPAEAPGKWTVVPSANPSKTSYLTGVSCVRSGFCMAGGTGISATPSDSPLFESWNGSEWSALGSTPPPVSGYTGGAISSVSCTSADFCMAVGNLGVSTKGGATTALETLTEVWDGRTWDYLASPNPPARSGAGEPEAVLDAVSCTSDSACTAVGSFSDGVNTPTSTLVEAWHGSWTIVSSPNPSDLGTNGVADLTSVSCATAGGSYCRAVGGEKTSGSTIHHAFSEVEHNGSWTLDVLVDKVPANPSQFSSVSCSSASQCLAVGYYQVASAQFLLTDSWNGKSWTLIPATKGVGPATGVSCISARNCTAVGSSGIAYGWNGSTWAAESPAPKGGEGSVSSVTCALSMCMAVGDYVARGVTATLAEYNNGLIVTHVSPSKLPINNPDPNPVVTVEGSGFTGATRVNFQAGATHKGFFVTSTQDGVKINAAGTRITFNEPTGIGPILKKAFGVRTSYTLDVRVVVGANTSPVNAPYDQVTFLPLLVTAVSPSKLPINPVPRPRITVDGTGFTGATRVLFEQGDTGKGFFIISTQDGVKINAAGTRITFNEPTGIGPILKKVFGVQKSYILDVRVVVGADTSPLNAPFDRITFS